MPMPIDAEKLLALLAGEAELLPGNGFQRRGDLFFVGACQDLRPALEAIVASERRAPVEIFHFRFADLASFLAAEEMIRAVRRNFRGYVLGQFHFLPTFPLLDQAYAAGIDLIDLPPPRAGGDEDWLTRLDDARTLLPRWSVLSSVSVDAQPLAGHFRTIDRLLAAGILPLLVLTPAAAGHERNAIARLFAHLQQGWERAGAVVRPLLPLLQITTPFTVAPRRGLAALVDKVQEAQRRSAADLRRLLRVREVEQSFESAGL